jgi:hypothetical protein
MATHKMLIAVKELTATDKAVKIEYKSKHLWIPKKLVSSIYLNSQDLTRFDYYIPVWFAKKIGIN